MVGPDSDKWLEAMKFERESMYKTKCRLGGATPRVPSLGGAALTRSRTTTEWYGNPVLEVMLLSNSEPTSYGESNGGPRFRQMAGSHEIRERIHV